MKDIISLKRKFLREENKKFTEVFVQIPKSDWPPLAKSTCEMIAAFRNRHFLVQVFADGPYHRLSINRNELDKDGDWKDGISWDELFAIKNAIGYAGFDAVEIHPRIVDVVNVANMRHLWVLPEPLTFGWRKKTG